MSPENLVSMHYLGYKQQPVVKMLSREANIPCDYFPQLFGHSSFYSHCFSHETQYIVLFVIGSLPIFNYKMQPALQLDNGLASDIMLCMADFHFHFWYILYQFTP